MNRTALMLTFVVAAAVGPSAFMCAGSDIPHVLEIVFAITVAALGFLAIWIACKTFLATRDLRKTRRQAKGQCIRCGYALYGLTEPRCPECGQPFAKGAQKHVPPDP